MATEVSSIKTETSNHSIITPEEIPPTTNKVAAFFKKYFPDNLLRELFHNFMRDFSWAPMAASNLTLNGTVAAAINPTASIGAQVTSAAFTGPLGAQCVVASAPMVLFAAAETAYRLKTGQKLTLADYARIWAPPAAAATAIGLWNAGQQIAANIASKIVSKGPTWFGTSLAVGLASSVGAGVAEGTGQWLVKTLFKIATDGNERKMWKNNPKLMTKLFTKELLLNATIGAIPGAVWQHVFFIALPVFQAHFGAVGGFIFLGLLVATAVGVCNYGVSFPINKMSQLIDQFMGWEREREEAQRRLSEAISG